MMFKILNAILFLLFGLVALDVVTCMCVDLPLGTPSLVCPGECRGFTRLFSDTSYLGHEQVWDV